MQKFKTLPCDYTDGGLNSVDIFSKILGLQCSWVRRLFNNNFHQWKVIPLYLIPKYLCKNFKFHSNLDLRKSRLSKFPKYYQENLYKWGKFLSSSPNLLLVIISQFIWFKKIQIDKTHVFFSGLSDKGLNLTGQLFDRNGKLKTCECLKDELLLKNSEKFKLFQAIHALPKQWREIVASDDGNLSNLFLPDRNLILKKSSLGLKLPWQ